MWVCTHFLMIKATYSSVEAITTVLSGNGPSLARAHPFGSFFSRIIDFIILKRDHSISLKCVDGIAIWKLNFFFKSSYQTTMYIANTLQDTHEE